MVEISLLQLFLEGMLGTLEFLPLNQLKLMGSKLVLLTVFQLADQLLVILAC